MFIIIIGGILILFVYITRLASNKIFSPSNKIHWEVGRAKDLSAPLYHVCKVVCHLACKFSDFNSAQGKGTGVGVCTL